MDGQMEFLNTATVRITPEILSLIAEIDEFKGAWRAIGRIAPERLSSLRRVATIERGGSVCLNSFGRFVKWISASIMLPPSLVPAR